MVEPQCTDPLDEMAFTGPITVLPYSDQAGITGWVSELKHTKYMGSIEGLSLSVFPSHHGQDTFFTSHCTSPNIKLGKHTACVPLSLSLTGIYTYKAGPVFPACPV